MIKELKLYESNRTLPKKVKKQKRNFVLETTFKGYNSKPWTFRKYYLTAKARDDAFECLNNKTYYGIVSYKYKKIDL